MFKEYFHTLQQQQTIIDGKMLQNFEGVMNDDKNMRNRLKSYEKTIAALDGRINELETRLSEIEKNSCQSCDHHF